MYAGIISLITFCCLIITFSRSISAQQLKYDHVEYSPQEGLLEKDHQGPSVILQAPLKKKDLEEIADGNPLIAAIILTSTLGLVHGKDEVKGFNHPQHLPVNPYVALFLSHYGRYVPTKGRNRGIYGYAAANNLHNNKPFGAYKLYEDEFN